MSVDGRYDVIVIGSGPGGAAAAQRLAATGKRILVLERGDYLPRSEDNWDVGAVFLENRYKADECWYDSDGKPFRPGLHRFVGGNSKVYGAALLRLRERDFEEVIHAGGVSPAWPLPYAAFEPYYGEAERLFHVHGARGEDPNEPWASTPFPDPPVAHEPRIELLSKDLRGIGLQPFHLPLGILLDEQDGEPLPTSPCIRCSRFDGFPCPLNAKADAQVVCIDPMLAAYPNTELRTRTHVTRLVTTPDGRSIAEVRAIRDGREERYVADIVIVACGALSSALLLLESANDRHPNGLANGSDQLGRNYLRHDMSVTMALLREPNPTVFQKTLALSDFYFGADDWRYPMGFIQMTGATHADQIRAEALPLWLNWMPDLPFEQMARHAMAFWLQSEDLPHPDNRIRIVDDKVRLDLIETNPEAGRRLKGKLASILERTGVAARLVGQPLHLGMGVPIAATSHQAGTARFGVDPRDSVLDLDCRAHEVDNLYLVDASFFPSIGAVNPTLTIIANALRVADRIAERIGAHIPKEAIA